MSTVKGGARAMMAHRAEALALVALTRSTDIDPIRVELGNLDFLAAIQDGKRDRDQLCVFGVIVKSAIELGSVKAANTHGKKINQDGKITSKKYYFPTLVLLFSMVDENGYFAWIMEPEDGGDSIKLRHHEQLVFHPFGAKDLLSVVKVVRQWYASAGAEMLR